MELNISEYSDYLNYLRAVNYARYLEEVKEDGDLAYERMLVNSQIIEEKEEEFSDNGDLIDQEWEDFNEGLNFYEESISGLGE